MDQDTQQSSRRGMLAGGNWIIDQVKIIDVYPKHENLANIQMIKVDGLMYILKELYMMIQTQIEQNHIMFSVTMENIGIMLVLLPL